MRRVEDLSPVQSLDMSLKFANGAGCVSRRSVAMSHGTKSTVSSGAKGAELRAHTRARTHTHAHSNGPFESRSALLISGTCVGEEGEQSSVKEGGTEGGGNADTEKQESNWEREKEREREREREPEREREREREKERQRERESDADREREMQTLRGYMRECQNSVQILQQGNLELLCRLVSLSLCIEVRCSVMQCVAVRCSTLQRVATGQPRAALPTGLSFFLR